VVMPGTNPRTPTSRNVAANTVATVRAGERPVGVALVSWAVASVSFLPGLDA
jgi:hypothetical protein